MLIFLLEVALILLVVLVYLKKELEISMRDFRHGDIIWVRSGGLKSQRAVLSKWNRKTFCYMLDGSCDLKFKRWFFLARNESYLKRQHASMLLQDSAANNKLAELSRVPFRPVN